MKTYKLLSLMLAVVLVLGSCEREVIGEIFDNSGPSLLSFEQSSQNLPVLLGSGTSTTDVVVEVSTISNTDRTFNVSVVNEGTTAPNDLYTVPGTVTIPANSYEGILTVTGNETADITTSPETVVIELQEQDNVNFTIQQTTLNVFLICPIPDDYLVGTYDIVALTNASANAFAGSGFVTNVSGPTGPSDTTVEISVGASQTERVFDARFFVRASTSNSRTRTLNLVCGEINLAGREGTGFTNFFFDPSDNPATYDLSDDTSIIVNYIDNPLGAFGGPIDTNAAFLLQKQ